MLARRVTTLLLFASPALGELTNCQKCCAPGGDCSKAFKGGPGKCCGTISGQAFCCPGAAGSADSAKCYNCGASFRCYGATSRPGPNICGLGSPFAPHSRSRQRPYVERPPPYAQGRERDDWFVGIMMLAVAIPVVVWLCRCNSSQSAMHYHDEGMYHCKPAFAPGQVAVGQPIGACGTSGGCAAHGYASPCVQPGYHGHPGYGHPHDYGYSGGAVAGGAAAGFVGGMLLGQAMGHGHNDHEVHHYHHGGCDGGGYGGGGYGGGGDYGYDGGGDGDDGFDADS